jgi:hypothetical protein
MASQGRDLICKKCSSVFWTYVCERAFNGESVCRDTDERNFQAFTLLFPVVIILWFSFQGSDLQSWNSWDDSPVSVITERTQNAIQQQIDLYRQQATRHASESEEPQPDFFEVCHWNFAMRFCWNWRRKKLSLQVLKFCPVGIIWPILNVHSFICHWHCLSNWQNH